MLVMRWHAPKDMRLEDAPDPKPLPHEALVKIESVGVCGSDMHYFLEGGIGENVLTGPTILGHEYAGRVVAVGEDADASLVGKRVAVEPGIPCMKCESCKTGHYNVCPDIFFPGGPGSDGALSEYYTVHADFCYPVPEDMPADVAAMVEPLAIAIHTVRLGELTPGCTVGIFGLGPIGLLVAKVASQSGAFKIYGSDLHDYRVAASANWGVDQAWNGSDGEAAKRILEATNGRGVDVTFDCSNGGTALTDAVTAVRCAGRVTIVGISGQRNDYFPASQARRKELTLQWVRRLKDTYPAALEMINSGRIDVRPMLTHSFPLADTVKAFEIVAGYQENVLKASIDQ